MNSGMSAARKVAVVTGSDQGIGFAIVRGLCKKFDGDEYLTSRDCSQGEAAVEKLTKEGLHPKFHQLDIDSKTSIEHLKSFLQRTYGGLDILVNNAGVAYMGNSTVPFAEQAECCPGYVQTDMSSHKGTKTIDEGADTPVYLALLPPNTTSPKGNVVADREIYKWRGDV